MLSLRDLVRWRFVILILLVSFSCMTYELILAQTAALLLGNALLSYSVTIGIYLGSLGFGSLLYTRLQRPGRNLVLVESLLAYLGPLLPILGACLEFALKAFFPSESLAFFLLFQLGLYVLIALVGILSGLELPILMTLAEEQVGFRSGAVLGLDYVGTLFAVAAFPYIGLHYFGLFGTAAWCGLMSGLAALLTLWVLELSRPERLRLLWPLLPSFVVVLSLLVFDESLTEFISRYIYMGNP